VRTWILKTEPQECSIDDIRRAPGGILRWDGIRNFQARNFIRDEVKQGDRCLIWHSGGRQTGLAGYATVVRAAYPDPTQFDPASPGHDPRSTENAPRWFAVDIRFGGIFANLVAAATLRAHPALGALAVLRQGRLSVSPVTEKEWRAICTMLVGEIP
jgi:predicted RNA-binding protein with PUA-like domain